MTGYTENVRMYLSHNLFGPDKLLVCFYTFINWHAQTQEERRPKKMKNTIGNIFIWPFVTRCLCIACSGREIAVFRRCICFFSLRLRGGNICAIVSGVQNQSFYPIFFFADLTSVGTCGAIWHMLQCISYCTCWDGWANETSILSEITYSTFTSQSDSRGLCFFSLSLPFDSIFGWRLIVVPFVWCAARDKTASHVNQGSSAAAAIGKEWTSTSQFEISLPDADDKPVVWALVVVRRAATGFLLRLETFEYSNTRSVWKKGGVWTANGMCVEIHRPSSNQQTWNYKFSDELNAECEMRKNQRSPCSPEIKISFETPVPFSERCRPIPIFGIEYR